MTAMKKRTGGIGGDHCDEEENRATRRNGGDGEAKTPGGGESSSEEQKYRLTRRGFGGGGRSRVKSAAHGGFFWWAAVFAFYVENRLLSRSGSRGRGWKPRRLCDAEFQKVCGKSGRGRVNLYRTVLTAEPGVDALHLCCFA